MNHQTPPLASPPDKDTGQPSTDIPVTERLLKRMGTTEEFPAISKHLAEINRKMSADLNVSNASELAGVILQDYALTSKLLKLVNSAYYGFAAGKVSTVTRAVVLLGYENVRLATLQLTLFDHFTGKASAKMADLKETIAASFWAGVLARDIAMADKDVDPEEAFICAMLGQLGKLALIHYLPNEYARICAWMEANGKSETRAVKAVCGVFYEDLGMAVARHWNFPDQICESIQALPKASLKNTKKPPAKLWILSSMVKDFCRLVQKNGAAPDSPAFKALVERYKGHVKINRRQLKRLVMDSLGRLDDQAEALNIDLGRTAFLKRLSTFYQPVCEGQDGDSDAAQPEASPQSYQLAHGGVTAPDAKEVNPGERIMGGIQEISQTMMDCFNLDHVASMSLEVLYRSLDFHRALMFVRDDMGRRMTARFGYGHNAALLVGGLAFDIGSQKDVFNLSIKVGKDLIMADATDPKLKHLIPDWYRRHLNAPAFIFLPVMFNKTCMGAFYADRDYNGAPISDTDHRHLSLLRDQLLLAIKFGR